MQIVLRRAELLLLWALPGRTRVRQAKHELVLAPSCLCCDTPAPHSSFAGGCKRSRDQLCPTAALQQPPVLEFQVQKAHQCVSDSRLSIIYKKQCVQSCRKQRAYLSSITLHREERAL